VRSYATDVEAKDTIGVVARTHLKGKEVVGRADTVKVAVTPTIATEDMAREDTAVVMIKDIMSHRMEGKGEECRPKTRLRTVRSR
jgi:hypothetical protein